MPPSPDPTARLARFLFIVVMAIAWTGGTDRLRAQAVAAGHAATGPEPTDPAVAARDAAAAVRAKLNAETFDVTAVVRRVGREPDAMFGWVRDQTFWVPYRGVLRGPEGVLMDRLGSSADRASLLAALLVAAGVPCRLARAELPQAVAE
ncbi:MAG: hypothetical protein JWO31_2458, partial [Phycisphaerales bacterium]|nr:hypothetical protein [Phycisphaerales bacterium]